MSESLNMDLGLPFIFILLTFGSFSANAKPKNVKNRVSDLEHKLMIIEGRLGLCESKHDMITDNSERLAVIELQLNDTSSDIHEDVDDKSSKNKFVRDSKQSHMYAEDDIRRILEAFQQEKILTARLREEISELKASVTDVNEDATQKVDEISDLKAAVIEVNKDLTWAKNEISGLKAVFIEVNTDIRNTIDDLHAIRNATEIVEEQCKQSDQEILAEVKTNIDSFNSSIAYLTQKLDEIDKSAGMALNTRKKADSDKLNSKVKNGDNAKEVLKPNIGKQVKKTNNGMQVITANPQSCKEIFDGNNTESGVYTVYPAEQGAPVRVYCDMETDGGGWTVFQRRQDGSEDFNRNWQSYELGFGKLEGEFWLGNKHVSEMTKGCCYELRIELGDFQGNKAYAKYGTFQVLSTEENYKLVVGNYSGNAGDALKHNTGMAFSTKDRDNDRNDNFNCAKLHNAWWYNSDCGYSCLNGCYIKDCNNASIIGVIWYHWKHTIHSLKMAEMKYRKI